MVARVSLAFVWLDLFKSCGFMVIDTLAAVLRSQNGINVVFIEVVLFGCKKFQIL